MKSIILTFALSMLALMLASCSSQPETTTTTTRQTTTTTNAAENRMPQPIGYRDNNMENDYGGISALGR